MTKRSKSQLLTTSAIASLAVLQLAPAAQAQESYGIHNDQPDTLVITVEDGETVEGEDIGIYADNGAIEVENDGEIRGNGLSQGGPNSRPSGGIVIAQPNSVVVNDGIIIGAANGVVTSYFFGEDAEGESLPPQALAENTTVENYGLIEGRSGVGVGLIGGGTVYNNGSIQAFTGDPQLRAQAIGVAIAEFPDAIRSDVTGIGSVTNTEEGLIEGQLFGVVLSGGGTIDNAGTIRTTGQFNTGFAGVSPFAVVMTAVPDQAGREAVLTNSGTIEGLFGVLAGGSLTSATLNNSGTIQAGALGVFGGLAGELTINNAVDGTIVADGVAVNSANGSLTLNNVGLVVSNGSSAVQVATANAQIVNSGTIQGAQAGIITAARQPLPDGTGGGFDAYNTTVVNNGTIIGTNNDGVRLTGGGMVDNVGQIRGVSSANNPSLTDGVSIFGPADVDPDAYVASVINRAGGEISGASRGVIVSGGGSIDNAGSINGGDFGAIIQNNVFADEDGNDLPGITAAVTNTGSIVGDGTAGLGIFGGLSSASIDNGGLIAGTAGDGMLISEANGVVTTVNNGEDGEIYGASSGIEVESGGLALTNAGTIRGDGRGDGFNAPADGGVAMSGSSSTIVNSGTISGAEFGIVTYSAYDPETDSFVGTIVDTTIENSGTITGENDDGIRLAGGGTITNSGTIEGLAQNPYGGTDGVSIFAHNDQDLETYSGTLINEETGVISGIRAGAALSSGGTVTNAGTITGEGQGVFIQGNALDGSEREGQVATLTNSGTISGTGDFGGTTLGGHGVSFGSNLDTATLTNSGTITSAFAEGVSQGSLADLTITNEESGVIEGGTSGIYGGSDGTMTIVNVGTIRGNGAYDGFDAPPDAGITIATADSSVTNSGTISGAGAGITTAYGVDEETGELVLAAIDTQVENSGTISGESNDGVRLIGGGSVTNSGAITGAGGDFADGISMFRGNGQAQEGYSAVVTNDADGTIEGARYGVILSMGGTVDNAGTIAGNAGGVLIQGSGIDGETGMTADVVNSGTITGAEGYGVVVAANLDEASVTNSGTISGADVGVLLGTTGTATLVNTGTIEGGNVGVLGDDTGPVVLDNAGTIAGGSGLAVQLGGFDDTITLRTGSHLDGVLDAGAGVDSLTLAGEVLELTDEQVVGTTLGVENFTVASGYWSTEGFVGQFDTLTIDAGGALQVNEFAQGEDFTSPIFTTSGLVTDNGLLVLNFSGDDVLSQFDSLAITGEGAVKLIGEAVFTVDGDTLTYTGGTTIANGGVILTGALPGSVTTEGDGFFQLGVGGTEGVFDGDIVNNGRFVFDRSDDYDFLGAFSGSGILDKYGDGTLTFMGDYGFDGVTNIFAGAVRIGGTIDPETDFNLGENASLDITGMDQTIGGLSGEETAEVELGEQTLTVDQEENTEFAGVISGLGGIVKDGDGILNLSGDSTYTGPTEVDGGKLAVNGSIVSNVTVNAGGTLGGNGTVGDTVVNDDGTLAPGNSIGRLTVDGDLAFAAGSVYEVEVNAAGEGDRVDATGAVTIADTASVSVLAAEGAYAPRTDYIIVTGADGVTGTFGSVTTDMAFLDPLLRYSADTVTLSLYRNDVDFADVAANANQASVAGAVQALGIDNPLFEAVLMQNATTAQASFDDLSGEILASTISGLTDDSRHLRNAMLAMAEPKEAGLFVWGSAFGGWGDFDATARNFGMNADHKGVVAGIGFGGQGFAVAVSGGVGGSDFDLDGRGDAADVSSTYLAAHATLGAPGGFHGAAGVSYAWHDIDTVRTVSGAAFGQSLASARDADTLQVFGEIGYDVMTGSIAITPFARLAHVNTESDAFTETGGNAALAVRKAKQETTFLSLGAKARFNADSEGFQPYVSAAWNRAFGDRSAVVSSQFVAGGPTFSIAGVEIPKNSAEVEAGFDYTAGAFSIGVAYSGTLASDRNTHGARITGKIAF